MPNLNLITPRQARAARAVLRMSVRELAASSGVSDSSIRRIEEGMRGTMDLSARLQDYYEGHGIHFLFSEDTQGVAWPVE